MIEHVVAQKATITAYVASAITFIFGSLALDKAAIIVGMLCAIGTFIVNWVYKQRHLEIAEKRLELDIDERQE